MRVIILMFIALTVLQCSPLQEINGVWLHTKSTDNSNQQQFSIYGKQIIDFKEDSILTTTFRDPADPNLAVRKQMDGVYRIKNNKLVIRTTIEKYKIKVRFMNDSLVLTSRRINNDRVIYKRLKESDKSDLSKEQFVNKSFLISSGNYTDSVFFMNDSLMLHCGMANLNRPLRNWELSDYKGYKLFHTSNQFFPGMIVIDNSDNTIGLNPYIKKNSEAKLTPLISELDNKLIIGNWAETERISIENLSSDETKGPITLEIEPDKIHIKVNNSIKTLDWMITPDFSRIYFTINKNHYVDSWKILDLNGSTLKMRITDERGTEDYIVVMKRNENGR